MSSLRTQVYLTREQRKLLDARGDRERKTLASLIREAVDQYLDGAPDSPDAALQATFGTLPNLEVPARSEWDRERG